MPTDDNTFIQTNSILTPPPQENSTPNAVVPPDTTSFPPIDSVVTTSGSNWNKNTSVKKVVAIFGVFLLMAGVAAGVLLVQQQQNFEERASETNIPLLCPFDPAQGRTIVTFNGGNVRSDQTSFDATNGPYSVNIPGGNYKVTLVSYDDHSTKPDQAQTKESWHLVLATNDLKVANSNSISDLPDGQDFLTEIVNSSLFLSTTVTSLTAVHSAYPDTSSPHSVVPVCAVFDTASTEVTAQCNQVKVFDSNWNPLTTTDLRALREGNIVRFTVSGTASSGSFNKARFTINGDLKPETTDKRAGTEEFYFEYIIPTGVDTFSVKGEVFHSSLGWM